MANQVKVIQSTETFDTVRNLSTQVGDLVQLKNSGDIYVVSRDKTYVSLHTGYDGAIWFAEGRILPKGTKIQLVVGE